MTAPEPKVLALMVCDLVVEDKRTGNKSLVNTFNAILTPQVPTRHDRLFVFAQVTDGRGKVPMRLELLGPNNEAVVRLDGEANFRDPLAILDIVIELRGVIFPAVGHYRFQLVLGDHTIADRPFNVIRGNMETKS